MKKYIILICLSLFSIIKSYSSNKSIDDNKIIEYFSNIGNAHNELLDEIYNILNNEKELLLNSSTDLKDRGINIFKRINEIAYINAIKYKGDINENEFLYLKDDIIGNIVTSINKNSKISNLPISEELRNLFNQIEVSYSESLSVTEYQNLLSEQLLSNIDNLTTLTEKVSYTIAVKIAQASIQYWNEENTQKWLLLYSEMGYETSGFVISKHKLKPNTSGFSFNSIDIYQKELDQIHSPSNIFGSKKQVLWADITGGFIGGIGWGVKLGVASGGLGSLAGFFVGGLLHGAQASAGDYLAQVGYTYFGFGN